MTSKEKPAPKKKRKNTFGSNKHSKRSKPSFKFTVKRVKKRRRMETPPEEKQAKKAKLSKEDVPEERKEEQDVVSPPKPTLVGTEENKDSANAESNVIPPEVFQFTATGDTKAETDEKAAQEEKVGEGEDKSAKDGMASSDEDKDNEEEKAEDEDEDEEEDEEEEEDKSPTVDDVYAALNRGVTPGQGMTSRTQDELLFGLKHSDRSLKLQVVMHLSEFLSLGTEETLGGFRATLFVPGLVELLKMGDNANMMLYAIRALSHLMEIMPNTSSYVIRSGGCPLLLEKLLNIQYIDVAEQAIQALSKLAQNQAVAITRDGGMTALLTFLDFFNIGVQRMAISICALLTQRVPSEGIKLYKDAIPNLTNLLQHHDPQVVERACVCFSNLADNFYNKEEELQTLCKNGLIGHMIRIISTNNVSNSGVSPIGYQVALHTLCSLTRASVNLSQQLLNSGILKVLCTSISAVSSSEGTPTKSKSTRGTAPMRPLRIASSQGPLLECLNLVNALAPPVLLR